MLSTRTMQPADIEGGLQLCRAARWNQLDRDWLAFLRFNPAGSRVAEKDARIVGSSATIRYGDHFSWIGMVLVDPAERGQGIGTRMLVEALDLLKDQSCVRLDATPAGEPIYRKLGFADEYWLSRMQAKPPMVRERATSQVMSDSAFQEVCRLDLNAFGADRSFLLQWIREGAPEYARVIESSNGIRGYMFGRHGANFEHLGPVVARDEEAARCLVGSCLAALLDKPVIIDIRREPKTWSDWLGQAGFSEQRPFLRMRKGPLDHPGKTEFQYAITGPEFG